MRKTIESIVNDLEEIKNGLFEIGVTEKGFYKNCFPQLADGMPIYQLIEEGCMVEIIDEVQRKIKNLFGQR